MLCTFSVYPLYFHCLSFVLSVSILCTFSVYPMYFQCPSSRVARGYCGGGGCWLVLPLTIKSTLELSCLTVYIAAVLSINLVKYFMEKIYKYLNESQSS